MLATKGNSIYSEGDVTQCNTLCCAEVASIDEDTSKELSVGELLERANRDRRK